MRASSFITANTPVMALVLTLVLACPALASGKRALSTFLPVYIFALNVSGGTMGVDVLVPEGTDVHEFSLRPHHVKLIENADVVLVNSMDFDGAIVKKAAGDRIADISEGIPILKNNPHVWLAPALAKKQVENIRRAFVNADPANAAIYEKNASVFIERLDILKREIETGLRGLVGKYLITFHSSFDYFALEFGLKTISLAGPEASGPSPSRMRDVYDAVRAEGIKAVFVEKQFPAERMEKLGQDLGVSVCMLDNIETGETSAGYYERAMRGNLESITACLGGK